MKPYYQHQGITIYHGDCREVLPTLEVGSVDLVLTDPPYGVGKAEWDNEFHLDWLPVAAERAKKCFAVIPGVANLLRLPLTVGDHVYRWTLSVHITNALVRGAFGFGNWIACAVYSPNGQSIYSCSQDATRIAISGRMPAHPSPKPYAAIHWMLQRLPDGTVLDPFMGSGTTLVAAKELHRQAIGIELDERYCEIAAKRLGQEVLPFSTGSEG